jgi:hypothetical protein
VAPITKHIDRPIIEDFAKEIRERRIQTAKPSRAVINFRTEMKDGFERDIVQVPIELLLYRKDNGRIASDVLDYERNVGPLDEADEDAQATLASFLEQKDREKTEDLRKSILHDGQREPAIITCDGFLINGNRRKLVMEAIHTQMPDRAGFAFMKVVILPGKGDPGGPPTLREIEQIENRYQLQSDGKAEYYGFDRALSIKRKIALGLSLREQLRDDPRFAEASDAELSKAVKKFEEEYLAPLECIDRYLKQFRREGQYSTISTGMSDREGRWQAFLDYSKTYSRSFKNSKWRIEAGVEEDEIGSIEKAAFDLIRLREIPGMGKIHLVMRDLPKYCADPDGKDAILEIAKRVKPGLPPADCLDAHGNPLKPADLDAKWAATNKGDIAWLVHKARNTLEARKDAETPLDLLEAAFKKLTHENMSPASISVTDLVRAKKVAEAIRDRADALRIEFYQLEKSSRRKTRRQNGPPR